jgi:hypothetical protein
MDPNHHFESPRAYDTFDCAVKKFKLIKWLDEILADPEVYVQHSHLSNCCRVLNQLNQIRSLVKFETATDSKLWPAAQELEMVNAKLGALLTTEELSFPPRVPPSDEAAEEQNVDETEEEEAIPVFEYQPVCLEDNEPPPRGSDQYNLVHEEQIRKIRERRGPARPRECIASDGEVEIWRNPPDPGALAGNGWIVESPEEYMPLAQAVGPVHFGKVFRETNGCEVRGSQPFYSFSTPKTVMPTVVQLKTDQNKESWRDGDQSLATCEVRWMTSTRGPIRSSFDPNIRQKDDLAQFHPISIEEEWKPPLDGTGPRTYVVQEKLKRGVFHHDIPPATKLDCLVREQRQAPPLTVEEEFHEHHIVPLIGKPPTRGNRPFGAVFPDHPTKKGATDSMTVRALRPTFS